MTTTVSHTEFAATAKSATAAARLAAATARQATKAASAADTYPTTESLDTARARMWDALEAARDAADALQVAYRATHAYSQMYH